jgi:phospholipid/cholesterol/gamma-HCH transport system substrate-binding protein
MIMRPPAIDHRMPQMAELPAEEQLLRAALVRRAHRELLVGVFALISLAVMIGALFVLTDAAMFHRRYLLTSIVADASGLRNGDPVRMRGVNIGRVRGFDMVPEGVAIRLEIDRRFSVPADSRVFVRSSGLLEGMIVDVLPGSEHQPLPDRATVRAYSAEGLLEQAGNLSSHTDSILTQIGNIVSPGTAESVARSAALLPNLLSALAATIEQERGDLRELGTSLRRSAAELERATANGRVGQAVDNVDSALVQLKLAAHSFAHASASLDSILARTERGSGTLGRLTRDDALYEQLLRASTSLSLLAEDVRRNPGRYVKLRIF